MEIGGVSEPSPVPGSSPVPVVSGSWQLETSETSSVLSQARSDLSDLASAGTALEDGFGAIGFALGNATDVAAAVTQMGVASRSGIDQAPKSSMAVVEATGQVMTTFESADQEMSETTNSLARTATGGSSLSWLKPGAQAPGAVIVRGFSGAG